MVVASTFLSSACLYVYMIVIASKYIVHNTTITITITINSTITITITYVMCSV